MRITCPTCSTQYDVDENDIAFTGQDVQCTECMTVWTQTRGGEASNPRLADALADDGEEIVTTEEEPTETAESEIAQDVDVPAEDASPPTVDEIAVEDTQDEAEVLEDTEADSQADDSKDDDSDGSAEPEAAGDEDEDEDEDNPVWKEIAALAEEARADSDTESTSDAEYSPPDEVPPIQNSPVIPDEGEPTFEAPDEDDRPWDVVADVETSFSDFVWEDPSKDSESETEADESPDADEPEFTPLADTSGGALEEMDDDLIAAALSEQMAIEDALEDAPKPEERDISDVPVELGGPRARIPNVEALKNSVRTKSVQLTSEELQEQVPARRFRRGFSLILLTFVVLAAIYITRSAITKYIPAVGPFLETYATFVELLRAKAEVLGAYVWGLMMQGFDWIIAKFF